MKQAVVVKPDSGFITRSDILMDGGVIGELQSK
jgi:hypothetical protein